MNILLLWGEAMAKAYAAAAIRVIGESTRKDDRLVANPASLRCAKQFRGRVPKLQASRLGALHAALEL